MQLNTYEKNIQRLESYKTFKANWDGEGGVVPQTLTIDAGIVLNNLLSNLPTEFVVSLDADSKPMFHLRNSNFDGYISVDNDGTISYYFVKDFYTCLCNYGLIFDQKIIPTDLLNSLSQV